MAQATTIPQKSVFVNRLAVLTAFFIAGAALANWAIRIPDISQKLGLSEGPLGLAILGLSVGVVLALPLAGGLISRFSSRVVTVVAGSIMCMALPLLAVAPNFASLWLALFVFGASNSTMDIAMNAQAVEVERKHGRPIMSSFHAFFSVGVAAGGGMGWLARYVEASLLTHFLTVGLLFLFVMLVVLAGLVNIDGEKGQQSAVFSLPPRALWLLGLLAFCAAINEGAMADWSTLYLENVVGAEEATAGFGFLAFSIAMVVGRFSGDYLATRISPVQIVRWGGLFGAAGITMAIVYPTVFTAATGFAMVGIGVSLVIPMAFSSAGNREGISPGAGIAGVATVGYAGFLAGPPIIGLVAQATSLRVSMIFLLVLLLVMAFNARALRPAK
ncbi:MAG: MFS transporter [Chloroflexota bacterium]